MAKVQDLSRLYSRRGAKFGTGIDRVERGIFEQFRQDPQNRFLIRFGQFYFLLPSENIDKILAREPSSRFADYRRLKRASVRSGLRAINLREFDEFWHIGHIRHREKFWQQVKADGLSIKILIHDVIPLDFPETCRAGQIDQIRANFDLWARYADHIMTPSEYSRGRILAHAQNTPHVTAHPLAVETRYDCHKDAQENAFVIISTIEPRKNHILLLNIWQKLYEEMGEQSPKLWIIGKRGWDNKDVFDFLDHSPLVNKTVFELSNVTDDQLKSYLCRAKALLFPSIVEGFGLPFYEAILSNRSVLASKIPVFEENLDKASLNKLLCLNNFDDWYKKIRYFEDTQLKLAQPPEQNWQDYLAKIQDLMTQTEEHI